ncbi:FadR/GntR family transcriptional regulator [Amaricoccus solimangrovi]|uniref:FadR family transcriptional regulator n=1 Tax=Amaricoccus solimangrovi TaxID=2589815 RepID=A0A501WML9_9RHOB|nr:FadR/GntR family transcriptional regulator [Amaricoccus solimangrovi]TPE48527.1 FadR family transcriptional regulator [Amaricoccus solimangrovi]
MGILDNRIHGPRPRGSHGHVVEELGRAIVAGEIPEGSILPGDQELMEKFGVSRTVLREAMKTLAAKRLIEAKSRVGTRVLPKVRWNFVDSDVMSWRLGAGVDLDFVVHLAEMRLALEPAAAALAAKHATNDEILELYAIAERMDRPDHTEESIAKVDLEFHIAIAEYSRNPFMRSVSSLIEAALAVSLQLSSPALSPSGLASCAANHLRIAHAIAARDPERAANAMRVVIDEGVSRIENVLA